jgi:hypothetical protein
MLGCHDRPAQLARCALSRRPPGAPLPREYASACPWLPGRHSPRHRIGAPWRREAARWFCHSSCLSVNALGHHSEGLTPVDRRIGCPIQDRLNLIPDGPPFGALTSEVEFGQHAFEPVDHLGMALKPWIGTTFVKKGFDLIHRVFTSGPLGVAPSPGYSGSSP